jgi:stress-induced morphogen
MVTPEFVAARIRAALPDARVEVGCDDDNPDHLFARVESGAFAGKTLVQQHQLVYAALQDKLSTGELHALRLQTSPATTPKELQPC